jgi:hypothetical protein
MTRRPGNFLIFYTAREGSTAIVSALSRNSGIQVPLLEELDRHWIKRFYDPTLDLPETLDQVFASGTFNLPHTYGRNNYLYYDPRKVREMGRDNIAVGFKWRPHKISHRLIQVLKKHDVQVFYLIRRDFRELVCSLYLSVQEVDGERIGHAQFDASRGEEEFRKTRDLLENLSPPARLGPIGKIVLKRLAHAMRYAAFLKILQLSGIKTSRVHYEDFLEDPNDFLADLCDRIGVTPDVVIGRQPQKQLRKVVRTPAKARVQDHERFPVGPVIRTGQRIYAALTRLPN